MNFSAMRNKVLRLLNDIDSTQFTDAELISEGIYSAMDAVLPWVARPSTTTLTGDGSTSSFAVPTDLYRVVAVHSSESNFYLPLEMMAPAINPNDKRTAANAWSEYPSGFLTFQTAPSAEDEIVVYYGAVWPKPVEDDDDLSTPTWLDTAIAFYTASYCCLQKATAASNVRQYNVQVDSGNPVMNPWKDMAETYLGRFKIEMDLVPVRMKGIR